MISVRGISCPILETIVQNILRFFFQTVHFNRKHAFRPKINSKGLNNVDSCLDVLYANKHVSIKSSQLSSLLPVHFVSIACIVWLNLSSRPLAYDQS